MSLCRPSFIFMFDCTVCMEVKQRDITEDISKHRDLLLSAVDELIFVRPIPAGPHTLVKPEELCMVIKLLERESGVWINDIPHLQITASQTLGLGSLK